MSRNGPLLLVLWCAIGLAIILACTRVPVRFVHQQHLGLACGQPGQPQCLTCLSCHVNVERAPGQVAHPSGENCTGCHTKHNQKVEASLHAPRTAAAQQATAIVFNHDRHLAMPGVGGQCISCHAGLVSDQTGNTFPEMERCFACHEHQDQWDRGECAPCHNSADLKKLFPRTMLRHGTGWDRQHATEALKTTVQCAQCHTTESCDDCHDVSQGLRVEVRKAEQVDKTFIHPADFLTRHAWQAKAEPARCLSCHRVETCDSCHQARGISAGRVGSENPHPPGWVGPNKNADNHHGRAARRDILSCASCHDQGPATNCIECHSVGGPGGNPHPHGWKSSRGPGDEMCKYCHQGDL